MPRRVRVETPGYYHIINRGVEQRKIYMKNEDKDKFLDILCKEFKIYNIVLHDYVLMDNHYHLLIQNYKQNLSDCMRQVNSKYAMYFNKKYKRVGHLWQGRYKSWIILDEDYLYSLFKYIELNPIKAKISEQFGEFYRSFVYDYLHNSILECSKNSIFLRKDIFIFLDMINEIDEQNLANIQKSNRGLKKEINIDNIDINKFLSLDYTTKAQRNEIIKKAYQQGIKQSDIAKFYNLSISSISKIVKN